MVILLMGIFLTAFGAAQSLRPKGPSHSRVIIFVWDGLRPDSVTQEDTPVLYQLSKLGTLFADHHSTYPTLTMMNATSIATGAFPGTAGFYGNTLYEPGPGDKDSQGQYRKNSTGGRLKFSEPVFTEDYAVLKQLNEYYKNQSSRGLPLVETLFQAAEHAHLKTAAVGKSGPAFLQDMSQGSIAFLDERMVYPRVFLQQLQNAGVPVPMTTPLAYPDGAVSLSGQSVNPVASESLAKMSDCVTSDPSVAGTSPYVRQSQFMMNVYLKEVLPKRPDLSVIWFRNPDSTEHNYGPGTVGYHDALQAQDQLLGQIMHQLKTVGLDSTTDIIVISDHAHSTVAGPASEFPLRAIKGGTVGEPDPMGFSVSGEVRSAALLSGEGFHAYDGAGCIFDPVLSGIRKEGTRLYATLTDQDGSICKGTKGASYTTANYHVPDPVSEKDSIVVAANGGSDYIYLPSHDSSLTLAVVRFLQMRNEFGPIFVDEGYGDIPGTLSLRTIKAQNSAGRNPDIIVSFNFDESAVVQGMKGTEYSSMQGQPNRGMHGSFSPIDVHSTLAAYGPDFRKNYVDQLPTGNVDIAPTVAKILHVSLPQAEGRPLLEALATGGIAANRYRVSQVAVNPRSVATELKMELPSALNGQNSSTASGTYTMILQTKCLSLGKETYTYFDYAKALRQPSAP